MAIIGVHLAGSLGTATAPIDALALALVVIAWMGVIVWPDPVARYAGHLVDAAVLVALFGGLVTVVVFSNRAGFGVLSELAFWAPVISVYWVTVHYKRTALAIELILLLYGGILWGDWLGHSLYGTDHFSRSVFAYLTQAVLLVGLMRLFSFFNQREAALKEELDEAVNNALRDPLTELPNRRFFDQELMRGCERAARDGTRLSVILVDIDHFKAFNDTHGHACGDEVLKIAASTIGERIRLSDWACRWGGEEFAIILHNTDLANARLLAEELRHAFASHRIRNGMRLTISLGVSECHAGDTPDTVFERADQALFRAKAGGRNRVEIEAGAPV